MAMDHSRGRTRKLTATALLSAVSVVLMYLEVALPFLPSFLKFDVSDFPALIVGFACGPLWGVVSCLLKNLAHLPASMTSGVGELANFLIGASFVLPASVIYARGKTRRRAVLGGVAAAFIMATVSFPVNLWITYPAYFLVLPREAVLGLYSAILPAADTLPKALLFFNLPFTLAKGLIAVFVTRLVYKPISRLIHEK